MGRFSSRKIVLCVEDFPPLLAGGGGRSNSVLARALAGHFRQVVVLHPVPSGLKTYVVSDAGATEVAIDMAWFGAFDVIHVRSEEVGR